MTDLKLQMFALSSFHVHKGIKLKDNESREKPGKLLVGQLKHKDASFIILAIKNNKGYVVTSVREINEVLKDFYSRL